MRKAAKRDPTDPFLWLLLASILLNVLAEFGCGIVRQTWGVADDTECLMTWLVVFPMATGTAYLLAIWAVMRGQATPWRFVGSVFVLACLIGVGGFSLGPALEWFLLTLAETMEIGIAMFVVRAAGMELTSIWGKWQGSTARRASFGTGSGGEERSSSRRGRLQFSLLSLLSWVTAVAVLLSTASVLSALGFMSTLKDMLFHRDTVSYFSVPAIMSPLCLWLTLGTQRLGVRLLIFSLSSILTGIIVPTAVMGLPVVGLFADTSGILVICLETECLLVALALPARAAGVRFA